MNWDAAYIRTITLLRQRREALGWTQGATAIRLGVGRRTLQRWEAGEAEPSAKMLFWWAGKLDVEIASHVAQSSAEG